MNNQLLIDQALVSLNVPQSVKDRLTKVLIFDNLKLELSPRGKGKGLKTNAPKNDHILKFIWRNARFNAGIDTTFPIMVELMIPLAFKDLPEYNESLHQKNISRLLDAIAMLLVQELGYNPLKGALIWKGLF